MRKSIFTLIVTAFIVLLMGCQHVIPSGGAPSDPQTQWKFPNPFSSLTESKELVIRCLDIGQGDATLISWRGKWTLIDTGDVEHRSALTQYLDRYGVKEVENLIITHPDGDHLGGAYAVLKHVPVRYVFDDGLTKTNAIYRTYLKTLDKKGLRPYVLTQGMQVDLGDGVYFDVLGPTENVMYKKGMPDYNNHSIVMKLVANQFTMLFTGDAEKGQEHELLKSHGKKLAATVLKVGHHGSKTGTTESFLAAVRPQVSTISSGRGNPYGVPHAPVLERLQKRGIRIYRTDRNGTITIRTDGRTYTVKGEFDEADPTRH